LTLITESEEVKYPVEFCAGLYHQKRKVTQVRQTSVMNDLRYETIGSDKGEDRVKE